MVTLLSSGKINNRLLCEIATHENFQRLMTDIEIFVDRIADMRIAQMNLVLEATRQEVIRSHAPGENDLYVRTLELGQVQESDFFSHTILPWRKCHLPLSATRLSCLSAFAITSFVRDW